MADILDLVDQQELRNEVQKKYRDVAEKPEATYHFHTGREHAIRLGYDRAILDQLPNEACERSRAWPIRFTGRRQLPGSAWWTWGRAAEWIPSSPPYAWGKRVGSSAS